MSQNFNGVCTFFIDSLAVAVTLCDVTQFFAHCLHLDFAHCRRFDDLAVIREGFVGVRVDDIAIQLCNVEVGRLLKGCAFGFHFLWRLGEYWGCWVAVAFLGESLEYGLAGEDGGAGAIKCGPMLCPSGASWWF